MDLSYIPFKVSFWIVSAELKCRLNKYVHTPVVILPLNLKYEADECRNSAGSKNEKIWTKHRSSAMSPSKQLVSQNLASNGRVDIVWDSHSQNPCMVNVFPDWKDASFVVTLNSAIDRYLLLPSVSHFFATLEGKDILDIRHPANAERLCIRSVAEADMLLALQYRASQEKA